MRVCMHFYACVCVYIFYTCVYVYECMFVIARWLSCQGTELLLPVRGACDNTVVATSVDRSMGGNVVVVVGGNGGLHEQVLRMCLCMHVYVGVDKYVCVHVWDIVFASMWVCICVRERFTIDPMAHVCSWRRFCYFYPLSQCYLWRRYILICGAFKWVSVE